MSFVSKTLISQKDKGYIFFNFGSIVFESVPSRSSIHNSLYVFSFKYSIKNSFVVFLKFFLTARETFFLVIKKGFTVTLISLQEVLKESST